MSEKKDEKSIQDYVTDSSPAPTEKVEEIKEAEQVETPEASEEDETSGLSEGLKKRFSKLTADKHRLKSAVEEGDRKLAVAQAEIARYKNPEPGRPKKPSEDDFADFDKYEDAKDKYFEDLADWKAKQRVSEFAQKDTVNEILSKKGELRKKYVESVEKSGIENYDDKFNSLVNALDKAKVLVPEYLIEAIQLDDNGPKIVEYLSEDPVKAVNLSKMGTVPAALEIGRLSAMIANGKPLQKTKAPPPVKPVKGSGVKPTDPKNFSLHDWVHGDLKGIGIDDR